MNPKELFIYFLMKKKQKLKVYTFQLIAQNNVLPQISLIPLPITSIALMQYMEAVTFGRLILKKVWDIVNFISLFQLLVVQLKLSLLIFLNLNFQLLKIKQVFQFLGKHKAYNILFIKPPEIQLRI